MKKTVSLIAILCMLCLMTFFAIHNLPWFCSYILSRSTGSTVTIAGVTLARKGADLRVDFRNIRLKGGDIEGTVKTCELTINLRKGLYFKHIMLSDFDLLVTPTEREGRIFTFPLEQLEIKRGVVTISRQKIIISEIKAGNVNIGDSLTFEARVENGDYIGTVNIRGEGIYNKRLTDIKGDVRFTAVNLARIDKILKGSVDGGGAFSFKDKKFVFEGKVEGTNFVLFDTWLRKPLSLDRVAAEVCITAAGNIIDIKIENAFYKETPFTLNIRLDDYRYSRMELSSDFLDVQDVTSYATTEHSLQNIWDALKGGRVRAKMLRDIKKGPITVDLEVKGISAVYQDLFLSDINGQVYVDQSKVVSSNVSGTYKTSKFYEVSTIIPYDEDRAIKVKGKYTLNLKDMPPFIDLKGITFNEGTTEGAVEVEARRGLPLNVRGSGNLNESEVIWNKASLSARGSYSFSKDEIVFDSLVVSKGSSNITCKGKWNDGDFDVILKGILDVTHLFPFINIPFDMTGMVNLDGDLHLNKGVLNANGDLSMDDLAFEIPGYMKKEKGIKSRAQVRISKINNHISVDELFYELDIIRLNASGTIDNGKKVDADIAMDAGDMGRVAKLFFLSEELTGGAVSLKLAIKDLELPVVKLPYMVGNVKISNGFFRLPGLSKPLKNLDLIGEFRGTSFDLQLNRLVCGQSVLKKATLRVKDLDSPQFSLFMDAERFNLLDFKGDHSGGFKVPLIPPGSILARTSGDLSLRAKEIALGKVAGKDLEVGGIMTDRKINISEFKAHFFDGDFDMKGIIDLSGKAPYFYTNGRLRRARSDLILQAFGTTTHEIIGRAFISGDLKSEGDNATDLIRKMDGSVTMYSKDGVIKKWNFLSKLFGILNVYDLLRGKVSFTQAGLGYNKLGAVFAVEKGVFRTGNFLLDSPSMVLTGSGDLDLNKNEVNGSIHVSPLIVLDRTLEHIPVVRNILKKRGQGFLYLSFDVEGSVDDPQITSNYTGTIGSKTIEIIRNILVLPKEVFE